MRNAYFVTFLGTVVVSSCLVWINHFLTSSLKDELLILRCALFTRNVIRPGTGDIFSRGRHKAYCLDQSVPTDTSPFVSKAKSEHTVLIGHSQSYRSIIQFLVGYNSRVNVDAPWSISALTRLLSKSTSWCGNRVQELNSAKNLFNISEETDKEVGNSATRPHWSFRNVCTSAWKCKEVHCPARTPTDAHIHLIRFFLAHTCPTAFLCVTSTTDCLNKMTMPGIIFVAMCTKYFRGLWSRQYGRKYEAKWRHYWCCIVHYDNVSDASSAGLSLIAVAPDGEVVGACLNGCHEPGHVDQMEAEAESCPNPKFRKILQLLAFVERRADVFGKFPEVHKLLEIRTVAVDGFWRGRAVATALLERTRLVAIHNTVLTSNCLVHCVQRKSGAWNLLSPKPEMM